MAPLIRSEQACPGARPPSAARPDSPLRRPRGGRRRALCVPSVTARKKGREGCLRLPTRPSLAELKGAKLLGRTATGRRSVAGVNLVASRPQPRRIQPAAQRFPSRMCPRGGSTRGAVGQRCRTRNGPHSSEYMKDGLGPFSRWYMPFSPQYSLALSLSVSLSHCSG